MARDDAPSTTEAMDAMEAIVAEVEEEFPGLEVAGLPITGRVLRLARYLEARREHVLGEFGLSLGDFDVLATMRRRAATEPINVRELQQSTMLSSGGTTKRLDRLEQAGLIERHPDPADRRGVLIGFTGPGRALIDAALPAVTRDESELVSTVIGSARRRADVADGLRRLLAVEEAR